MTKNSTAAALATEPTERTVGVNPVPPIHEAFVKVCAEVENVKRDKEGQVGNQKYKYATLEQVLDMINPIMSKYGLALAQFVDGDALMAKLISSTGESMIFGSYNLGELEKHQGRGSAISYGRRYQLCSIFGITQEDDDAATANSGPKVFKTAAMRKEWIANFTELLKSAGSVEDLRGIWISEVNVLEAMKKSSDDYDRVSYEHAEKMKDVCKNALIRAEKEWNGHED